MLNSSMFSVSSKPEDRRFGLVATQSYDSQGPTIAQALWVNQAGEYLGWGSLSCDDLIRIRDGLQEGEVFIAVDHASAWGPSGDDDYYPLPYVAANTSAIIFPGIIWLSERLYKKEKIAKKTSGQIMTDQDIRCFLQVKTEAVILDAILEHMAFWAVCREAPIHQWVFRSRTNVLVDDQRTSIHLCWEATHGKKIEVIFQYANATLTCSWNFLGPDNHRHTQCFSVETTDSRKHFGRRIANLLNQWRQNQGKEPFAP